MFFDNPGASLSINRTAPIAKAAMPPRPKKPAWPVTFGVKTTKAKAYKKTFDQEMTKQLTGVTMNEPGVSRLVAVDIDEAVKLVAS